MVKVMRSPDKTEAPHQRITYCFVGTGSAARSRSGWAVLGICEEGDHLGREFLQSFITCGFVSIGHLHGLFHAGYFIIRQEIEVACSFSF